MTADHSCIFGWCEVDYADPDHNWIRYTRASLRGGDPWHLPTDKSPLTVGVGVAYTEGEMPAVVVHVDGGAHNADQEAHLTVVEATQLRESLDRSIRHAVEALAHMTADMTKQAGGDNR